MQRIHVGGGKLVGGADHVRFDEDILLGLEHRQDLRPSMASRASWMFLRRLAPLTTETTERRSEVPAPAGWSVGADCSWERSRPVEAAKAAAVQKKCLREQD